MKKIRRRGSVSPWAAALPSQPLSPSVNQLSSLSLSLYESMDSSLPTESLPHVQPEVNCNNLSPPSSEAATLASSSLSSSSHPPFQPPPPPPPPPPDPVNQTIPFPPPHPTASPPPYSQTLASNDSNSDSPAEPYLTNPNPPIQDLSYENGSAATVNGAETSTEQSNPRSGEDQGTGTTQRRRRSRWDPQESENGDSGSEPKKRKSRWADDEAKPAFQLPAFMKEFIGGGMDVDPEIQVLNARLLEISQMLQSNLPLDDRPEGARSPSPEPLYDMVGIRINTREYRARERLNKERQDIISQIIKRNPAFKPPADYRPPKLQKKLYIPMKEYPGYNFIGLIIGPRGNTQKRMEKETGAKIVIRGKGSAKEGRLGQKKDLKYDPAENEDLHVLVEAETQEALDAAAGMVEKLLQPVDEGLNEHKRQQLRELAALNGTIREDEYCRLCGEQGHRQYACPGRLTTFKSDVLCKICGDGGHPTVDCPVKGTAGKKMDDEYQSFLEELGGTVPGSITNQTTPLAIMGSNNSKSFTWVNNNSGGGGGGVGSVSSHPGLGSNPIKIGKEIDDTNLYIGYLPPTLNDAQLIELFSQFGEIVMAKVIKDRISGFNKGYGFVKYSNVDQANQAIASMNGFSIDGRVIAVRVAGKPPQPAAPPPPPPPPPPPAPAGPSLPIANQGGSGPQQITSGGPRGGAPPVSYMGSHVPWGPPPPPRPYAAYAPPPPPPPGSNIYTGLHNQPLPPYSIQIQFHLPPGVAGSSESQSHPCYPPGVQSQNVTSPQTVGGDIYRNSMNLGQQNSQSAYPPSSFGYSSYHGGNSPSVLSYSSGGQQGFSSGQWGSNPPLSTPVSSAEQNQQAAYGADPEYEKFMAELK